MSGFTGFPKETFAFMRGLGQHNTKAWFDGHRGEYEAYILEPAQAFVVAMGDTLASVSPSIHFDPRINGSIRRLNRDIRFSKDKTPYKDHLDIHFWENAPKNCSASNFFFRLKHDRIYVGAGVHEFSKDSLKAYRNAVVDPEYGRALSQAVAKVEKAGYSVGGVHYKQVPRGYDAANGNARFLLHTGLHGVKELKVTTETHTPRFLTTCLGHYKKLMPLHTWLLEAVTN